MADIFDLGDARRQKAECARDQLHGRSQVLLEEIRKTASELILLGGERYAMLVLVSEGFCIHRPDEVVKNMIAYLERSDG